MDLESTPWHTRHMWHPSMAVQEDPFQWPMSVSPLAGVQSKALVQIHPHALMFRFLPGNFIQTEAHDK